MLAEENENKETGHDQNGKSVHGQDETGRPGHSNAKRRKSHSHKRKSKLHINDRRMSHGGSIEET